MAKKKVADIIAETWPERDFHPTGQLSFEFEDVSATPRPQRRAGRSFR